MTTVFKTFSGAPQQMGPRTVRVIASDATVDLAGDQVVPEGIDLSAYLKRPVVLWSHNPEKPIGTASAITLSGGKLMATIEFYPAGVSHKADEVCALVKGGFVSGVSIGFDPESVEPLDPAKPRGGGVRYLKSKLMEISVVVIPANPNADVVQRALKSGRTLSGANEAALQAAHDMAENCRAGIASVLEGAATAGAPQPPGSPPPQPATGGGQDMSKAARMALAAALARTDEPAPPARPRTRQERLASATDLATEPLQKLRLKSLDPNEHYITRMNADRQYRTLTASRLRSGG
jgi:HK97 family phage prohead protease